MNSRLLVVTLVLAACGKGTKEQAPSTTEPKVQETPGKPAVVKTEGAKEPVKAASRGPERLAYSLIDNRLSAHLTRGNGLVLPAGSAAFAKYTRFANVTTGKAKKTWDLRQLDGDTKVAVMNGKSASVFVPLTAAQAGRGIVRLRMKQPEEGTLSLRVNDNKDINTKVSGGWSTVEVTVPDGQLKEGENALQFFVKNPGNAVAWIQIGGKTAVPDDGSVTFYDPAQKAIVIPKQGQMSWFVMPPEKARLTADITDGSCTVAVLATSEDGATIEGKLTGLGSAVELGTMSGKAVRLDLEAQGCEKAALTNAALVIPGEAPAPKRGEAPKYVLFVIMDSLRADRVRAFNAKARPESPNFEKLAESSTLFMQHYVQGNESQVSHASMWTSMYLAKHRASAMKDKLPERYVTIDDVAKKAGKYVAGVSANGYIRPARGFGTSWDKFINHIESSLGLKGADVMEKGLSFITPKKDQPWFLYLGMIDTHVTWRAKQPWMDKYDGGYKGRFADSFGDDGKEGFAKDLTDREKDHVRALYDSNVSYQDDLLGKLIAKLQEWGIYDQTMIVVTADHGDEQWEDGRVGHAGSQKETLIHVPLVIRYPAMFPAVKIDSGTEGIDITPTIADAVGVANDPEWQGQSLIPLANGQVAYPLMATSSQYENFHGGRIGNWKIRVAGTGKPELYNLAKDGGERKDLWGTAGAAIASRLMLDPIWMLRSWNVEWKKSQWGNPAGVSSRFAADLGE
jgi:arylsulfatase A-like enzyme